MYYYCNTTEFLNLKRKLICTQEFAFRLYITNMKYEQSDYFKYYII